MYVYRDLINADGSRNADAFAAILERHVANEIKLRTSGKAAELGPISEDEYELIVDHERAELEGWCRAIEGAR